MVETRTFKLDRDPLVALEKAAEQNDRSVSAEVRVRLRRDLERDRAATIATTTAA